MWWSEWLWALLVASGILLLFNGGVALTIVLWIFYLLNGYKSIQVVKSAEAESEFATHIVIGFAVVILSIGIKLWVHGGFAAILAVIGFILLIVAIVALLMYLKRNKAKIKKRVQGLLSKAKYNVVVRKKKLVLISIVSVTFITSIVLLNSLVIPSIRYNKATTLYDRGNKEAAYEIFVKNGNFKDSDKFVFEYEVTAIRGAQKGDVVSFGRYYSTTSKDKIEWIVVNVYGNQYTLISKYCLDVHPFHKNADGTSWADCELNKWLNTKFINEAFNQTEQEAILPYSLAYGSKVFIPSQNEAKIWIEDYKDREAELTTYADNKCEDVNKYYTNRAWWWLRTQADFEEWVYIVDIYGSTDERMPKDSEKVAVRPVIIINVE